MVKELHLISRSGVPAPGRFSFMEPYHNGWVKIRTAVPDAKSSLFCRKTMGCFGNTVNCQIRTAVL